LLNCLSFYGGKGNKICTVKYLSAHCFAAHNTFTQKLKLLLAEYPTIDIKAMGFPAGWHNEPLWS
jgi:hypothetical protein